MKHTIRKFKLNKQWGVKEEVVQSVNCEFGSGMLDCLGTEIIEGDIVEYEGNQYHVLFQNCQFILFCPIETYELNSFCPAELAIVGHVDD